MFRQFIVAYLLLFLSLPSTARDVAKSSNANSNAKSVAPVQVRTTTQENCLQQLGPEAEKAMSCINRHLMSFNLSLTAANTQGNRAEDCFSEKASAEKNGGAAAALTMAYTSKLKEIEKKLNQNGNNIEALSDADKRFLAEYYVRQKEEELETKHNYDVVKNVGGLKFDSNNKEDFSKFDFEKLRTNKELRNSFEKLYGAKETKKLLEIVGAKPGETRVRAVQIGSTVFYPKTDGSHKFKKYQTTSADKFKKLIVDELTNFKTAADELLRYSKEYSSLTGQWNSAIKGFTFYGLKKAEKSEPEELMDYARKDMDRSYQKLKYDLGLDGPNMQDLNAMNSEVNKHVSQHSYDAIGNSTKLLYGSIGAAIAAPALVFTAGAAGTAGVVGTMSKSFLIGMGISGGAAGGEATFKAVIDTKDKKDFWCNLGENFLDAGATTLHPKSLAIQMAFSAVPGVGKLLDKIPKAKSIMALVDKVPKKSAKVLQYLAHNSVTGIALHAADSEDIDAPPMTAKEKAFLVVGGAVGQQAKGVYDGAKASREDFKRADELEKAGHYEAAEAARREAKKKMVGAASGAIQTAAPIVSSAIAEKSEPKTYKGKRKTIKIGGNPTEVARVESVPTGIRDRFNREIHTEKPVYHKNSEGVISKGKVVEVHPDGSMVLEIQKKSGGSEKVVVTKEQVPHQLQMEPGLMDRLTGKEWRTSEEIAEHKAMIERFEAENPRSKETKPVELQKVSDAKPQVPEVPPEPKKPGNSSGYDLEKGKAVTIKTPEGKSVEGYVKGVGKDGTVVFEYKGADGKTLEYPVRPGNVREILVSTQHNNAMIMRRSEIFGHSSDVLLDAKQDTQKVSNSHRELRQQLRNELRELSQSQAVNDQFKRLPMDLRQSLVEMHKDLPKKLNTGSVRDQIKYMRDLHQMLSRVEKYAGNDVIVEDYLRAREFLKRTINPGTSTVKFGDVELLRVEDTRGKVKYTVKPGEGSEWNRYAKEQMAKGKNIAIELDPLHLERKGAEGAAVKGKQIYDFEILKQKPSDLVTHESTHTKTLHQNSLGLKLEEGISYRLDNARAGPELSHKAGSSYDSFQSQNEVKANANQTARIADDIKRSNRENLGVNLERGRSQLAKELIRVRDNSDNAQAALKSLQSKDPQNVRLVKSGSQHLVEVDYNLLRQNEITGAATSIPKKMRIPVTKETFEKLAYEVKEGEHPLKQKKAVADQYYEYEQLEDRLKEILTRDAAKKRVITESFTALTQVESDFKLGDYNPSANIDLAKKMRVSGELNKPEAHQTKTDPKKMENGRKLEVSDAEPLKLKVAKLSGEAKQESLADFKTATPTTPPKGTVSAQRLEVEKRWVAGQFDAQTKQAYKATAQRFSAEILDAPGRTAPSRDYYAASDLYAKAGEYAKAAELRKEHHRKAYYELSEAQQRKYYAPGAREPWMQDMITELRAEKSHASQLAQKNPNAPGVRERYTTIQNVINEFIRQNPNLPQNELSPLQKVEPHLMLQDVYGK